MQKTNEIAPSPAEIRHALIDMAAEFVRVTGLSKSSVGRKALNDTNFLFRVEDGEDFTMKSYGRIYDFMARNWPRDTVPAKRNAQGRKRT